VRTKGEALHIDHEGRRVLESAEFDENGSLVKSTVTYDGNDFQYTWLSPFDAACLCLLNIEIRRCYIPEFNIDHLQRAANAFAKGEHIKIILERLKRIYTAWEEQARGIKKRIKELRQHSAVEPANAENDESDEEDVAQNRRYMDILNSWRRFTKWENISVKSNLMFQECLFGNINFRLGTIDGVVYLNNDRPRPPQTRGGIAGEKIEFPEPEPNCEDTVIFDLQLLSTKATGIFSLYKCRIDSDRVNPTTNSCCLRDMKIGRYFDMRHSIWLRDAEFHRMKISGGLRAQHAVFHETAGFGGIVVEDDAFFNNARFLYQPSGTDILWKSSCAYFGEHERQPATFKGNAFFESALFTSDANFTKCTFHRTADFSASVSSEGVPPKGVTFGGDAVFVDVRFQGDANFAFTQFESEANFGKAEFAGDAVFNRTTFKSKATFSRAEFRRAAVFRRARFETVFFNNTRFYGDADFSLGGDSDRENRTRIVEARFYDARFKMVSNFCDVQFDKADFSNAIFEESLQLYGASIQRLDLKNTKAREIGIRFSQVDPNTSVPPVLAPHADQEWTECRRQYLALKRAFRNEERYDDEDHAHRWASECGRRAEPFLPPWKYARWVIAGLIGTIAAWILVLSFGTYMFWFPPLLLVSCAVACLALPKYGKFMVYRVVFGYGVRIKNLVIVILIVIFAAWILYWIWYSSLSVEHAPTTSNAFNAFYFSVITYATVGYGDMSPQNFLAGIALTEGVLGVILNAALVVMIFRKLVR